MNDRTQFAAIHVRTQVDLELNELFSEYRRLQSSKSYLVKSPQGIVVQTSFQALFNHRPKSDLGQLIHQHVMSFALKAELNGPGCFENTLRKLLNNESEVAYLDAAQPILCHSRTTMNDIRSIIAKYVREKQIVNMLCDALDLAGFNGRIVIEKSGSMNVEHVNGYVFPLVALTQQCAGIHVSPHIVCIDGFIESVSEIHSLFEQIAESGQTCALFVRGMSDDVKHTIKINYDRGKMRVIPFTVPFDFNGMNTLVDIAVVAGGDVVSTHKGDLISAIKLNTCQQIDRIDVSNRGVVLYNRRTVSAVKSHLSRLQTKIDEVNEHLENAVRSRIQSLCGNVVFLRIIDDVNFIVNSQAIDYALRAIKSAIEWGVSRDRMNEVQLGTIEPISQFFANRCRESIAQLGAAITLSNQDRVVPSRS